MTVGGSIFLIAVGAILRYAITDSISGVDLAGDRPDPHDRRRRRSADRRCSCTRTRRGAAPSSSAIATWTTRATPASSEPAVRLASAPDGRGGSPGARGRDGPDRRPPVARCLRPDGLPARRVPAHAARTATSSSPTIAATRRARCAACRFGATGWIGALGVAPEARRRGLGRALTEAAIARLHARGAATVLLFATDMGRPLYEHLGFATDGSATAWRGIAGVPVAEVPGAAPARGRPRRGGAPGPRGDRRGARADARHAAAPHRPRGRARRRRWRAGRRARPTAPASRSAPTATRRASRCWRPRRTAPRSPRSSCPTPTRAPPPPLRRWGFRASNAGDRMRLGPPVAWRPERQFGLFNLFWG